MVNKGKKFEELIKRDFAKLAGSKITRLYDPVGGYKAIKNVCDFIGYCYPYCFYFEAKATKGNTFNFSNLTQYEALLEYVGTKGIYPGVLVWFYEHNKVVWCSIEYVKQLKDYGIKSINVNNPNSYDFEVNCEISRLYPKIDFKDFYTKISKD